MAAALASRMVKAAEARSGDRPSKAASLEAQLAMMPITALPLVDDASALHVTTVPVAQLEGSITTSGGLDPATPGPLAVRLNGFADAHAGCSVTVTADDGMAVSVTSIAPTLRPSEADA